jgi:DNA-binding response OmpR family regulator
LARILVADDELVLVDLLRQVLEDAGYEVVTAGDVAGVLECVRSESPDLVLLDLFLGTGDGLEVIRALREEMESRGLRVVLCTAATRELEAHGTLLDELKVPVLEKPFNLDDLLSLIAAELDGR